jgi:hypothetical protein
MHKFNLVENALDSLEHAISHLTLGESRTAGDFKRAILDLSHVAELLFKERLRRVHPAFIFSNVDKYPSSTAFTISAGEALNRLERIADVQFNEFDQSALKTIREMRNEIEHFEFEISEDEARIVIGNVLVFIFRFSCDELDLNWADRRISDAKWMKLNEYAEFYEAQRIHVLGVLRDSDLDTTDCAVCRNPTFDFESEVCVLCGRREEVLKCLQCESAYLSSSVEYVESRLCPDCEWEDGYAMAHHEKY